MQEANVYLSTVGVSLGGNQIATPHYATITASTSGDNQIVAADPNNRIRVVSYVLVGSGSVNGKWRDGTTDITGLLYMAADTGVSAPFEPLGHFQTSKNAALQLNLSGSVAVGGHLTYILVPA